MANRTCSDCKQRCAGKRCRTCSNAKRKSDREIRRCEVCKAKLSMGTAGNRCKEHRIYRGVDRHVQQVIAEEAKIAPSLPPPETGSGDWLVLPDPHVPFHDPDAMVKALKQAVLLGVRQAVIPGDLIHGDIISRYINAGRLVPLRDELVSTGRVLDVLENLFDRIVILMGNHDQRLEKLAARWSDTRDGRRALEMIAELRGVPDDPESVTQGLLEHFFGSKKVDLHPLPDMIINNEWLVLHPGSCSRISPQTERRMAEKHRKSVIAGHNHLFGIGFDASGKDVAANIGHMADDSKFRYMREKQTTFPTTVKGWCFILCDDDAPRGRILPIAHHPKWFDLERLRERLTRAH